MNEDGKSDLLIESWFQSYFHAFAFGDGAGGFSSLRSFWSAGGATPFFGPTQALGWTETPPFDANGDGHLDVIAPFRNTLAFGFGNGAGGVSHRRLMGPAMGYPMIGDVDEDGSPDVVMAGAEGNLPYGRPILVYLNRSGLANRRAARAFLAADAMTIPIGAAGRDLTLRVEPVDASYQNADLDPASIVMRSTGTGSVNQIAAIPAKRTIVGDLDGNGVAEVSARFAAADLERLFSSLHGRQAVPVVVEGRLAGGGRMHAELALTLVHTGAATAPTLSPNPLNPTGTFRFATTKPGAARIAIYDVQGRLVRTLVDRALPSGEHEALFDGKDRSGRPLASGVYYARVATVDGTFNRRMAIVK